MLTQLPYVAQNAKGTNQYMLLEKFRMIDELNLDIRPLQNLKPLG